MTKDLAGALHDGMNRGSWNVEELWIAAFALGGVLSIDAVVEVLAGTRQPSEHEYAVLRVAINEHLGDLGLPFEVAAWSQIPGPTA